MKWVTRNESKAFVTVSELRSDDPECRQALAEIFSCGEVHHLYVGRMNSHIDGDTIDELKTVAVALVAMGE